ncbi:hypothetical protein [Amycolatopsis sp. NPDC098790]|uniref:hypothetical protein n=1 Tax=Amycolatopsis sp. NPDC098790 TaxID=3363939 RepID=UPI00381287A2
MRLTLASITVALATLAISAVAVPGVAAAASTGCGKTAPFAVGASAGTTLV